MQEHSTHSMTRRDAIAILAAAGFLGVSGNLFGCSSSVNSKTGNQSNADANGSQNGGASSEFVPATTDNPMLGFAADSSSLLLKDSKENSCYSPISLYLCTALLAAGTQGDTQNQILEVLRTSSAEGLATLCKNAIDTLAISSETTETSGETNVDGEGKLSSSGEVDSNISSGSLLFANSIWSAKDWQFTDAYLATAKDNYYAIAKSVEFGTEEANNEMTNWVSENTNGLLKPEFNTTSATLLSLINTVYFKDSWKEQFAVENTEDDTFHGVSGDVTVPFLNKLCTDSYAIVDGTTIADLYFSTTGTHMRFALPDENTSVQDLLGSPDGLIDIFTAELDKYAQFTWALPKFSIDGNYDLVSTLKSLGADAAFAASDDFGGMLVTEDGKPAQGACVDSVEQGTHISLDENGVEAAAYTAISVMESSLAEETLNFVLNRPFLYAILAEDNTVLFVGTVNDL